MPENPTLKKDRLAVKIITFVLAITLFSTTIASLINFHQIYWKLYPIPIAGALLLSGIIYYLLRPLEALRQAAQVYSKGELAHRINIHSGDEIEEIGNEFNNMAANLDHLMKNVSSDKDTLGSEKNKLDSIISSIADGIIVLNLNKQIVMVNNAALTLTGYTDQEMKSIPLESLMSFTNKDGHVLQIKDICPVSVTTDGSTPFINNETFTMTGKMGKKVLINLTSSPIHSSIQTDLGCILSLHSLEKEKQLESIQLDFVSMASHELRTPLTSIIGYLSVFMDENKTKFNSEQNQFLDRIMISAKQLSGLINNLLSVSKVERGAMSMNSQNIDWVKFLTQIVDENKVVASQKNISLTLNLPDRNLPPVKGDVIRITEVINNLISNAVNYTKNGGSIEVGAKNIGNEIVTSVKDNGAGIPEDAIPHLFSKFFRVSGALDKASNSKGTGLGLYLSKEIIDMHKGRIWVESKLGEGSTFYFSLPIAIATPSLTVPPNPFLTSNIHLT